MAQSLAGKFTLCAILSALEEFQQVLVQSPGKRTIFSSEPVAFEVARATVGCTASLWTNDVEESDHDAPPGAMGCDLDAVQSHDVWVLQ